MTTPWAITRWSDHLMHNTRQEIVDLLDHLAAQPPVSEEPWRDWRITPAIGGFNNVLYRCTRPDADLAVKFTQRDQRHRAAREFAALHELREQGLALAPSPVYVDVDSYANLVVVQSWVAGPVSAEPPDDAAAWDRLLQHYAAIHAIKPEIARGELPPAVLTFTSARDGIERIGQQLAGIPDTRLPVTLRRLMNDLHSAAFPPWPPPPLTLCRVDPNLRNFIRRPDGWLSVDWENSGWGDPAFEIADLLAHPTCLAVTGEQRRWVMARYAGLRGDSALLERTATYYVLMLAWWAARFARMCDDIAMGRHQPRLTQLPVLSMEQAAERYQEYLRRAQTAQKFDFSEKSNFFSIDYEQ
jgi:aminoglycoside phosphotransferase (APT) family kinase protein